MLYLSRSIVHIFKFKHEFPKRFSTFTNKNPAIRGKAPLCTRLLENQPNLAKDVVLFKYDNPKFYKYLNVFALVQFFFWAFIGQFSVSSMRDVPVLDTVDETLPWWKKINLGEGKYKHSMALVCYAFGTCILGFSWMFTLRSVRYLILNKSGKQISVVTYTPFGQNRIIDVPLSKMSAVESRANAKSTLPLKVFGQRFYYLLDMRGEFRNPQLFDITAGLHRKF